MNINEKIGFGCYLPRITNEEAENIISLAIESGYRYFDTASFYETERVLGSAVRRSGLKREELFIATKLWIDEKGYQNTKDACQRSLDRLGMDYLDAYLIHWPKSSPQDPDWKNTNNETFRALQELKEEGLIKHIGVCNFLPHHLNSLREAGYTPEINQIELHPGYTQENALRECLSREILVQAWSPLGRGAILENEYLISLSQKYGKSVPQLCLIYLLQRGIMPIVKASKKKRMLANLNVFDVKLEEEDLLTISCMPQTGWAGEHPDFAPPSKKSNFDQ